MIQVLHLMTRAHDLQTARTSAALRRSTGPEFTVTTRTIGRGGDYRHALHAAASLRFARTPRFHLVHAWDAPSFVAAAAGPLPVIYSRASAEHSALPRWAMVYCNRAVIATPGIAGASQGGLGGVPSRRHVVPPAFDWRQVPSGRNETIRTSLGFGPDDRVILIPGESSRSAGHGLAIHAASILHVLDERHRVLLWGRGSLAGSIARLGRKLGQPLLVTQAERRLGRPVEFEELLAAADLALLTPTASAPLLPSMLCMAAGLPIVAAPGAITSQLLVNGRTACVVERAVPRLLAARMLDLLERPALARDLGAAAREAARVGFDEPGVVDIYRGLYFQAVGGLSPVVRRDSALSRITVTGPSLTS